MTRLAALGLTLVTGFSGLVYEVSWQNYLATLLGSHSEATAAVLAIFLGGLSVGYAVFGAATKRLVSRSEQSGRPLRLLLFYAVVEAGIGVYALLFPLLFGVAQAVSQLAPGGLAGFGFAFDVVLSMLLIGPPSILMGGTIPILTLALTRDLEESTRIHALVYGFNTAGAFFGALAGAFILLPALGLDGSLYAMGCLNVVAGGGFVLLDRLGAGIATAASPEEPGASTSSVEGLRSFVVVALLAGFAMMTIQTVLNRIGALAFGSSHFTFAMVVAVFVLSIALGSFAVSALSRIPPWVIVASQWLLVYLLTALYRFIPDTTYHAHVLRTLFRSVDPGFYVYYYVVFTAMLVLLVIPIGLSGALLPLLFHHMRGQVGELGAVAGKLYSWNTAGSLLGALLGGYVLLFWLDLDQVYTLAVGALVINLGILTPVLLRVPKLPTFALIVVPAAFFLAQAPDWDAARLSAGVFREREPLAVSYDGADAFFERHPQKIIFHSDGPNATAAVREGKAEEGKLSRSIITNGKSDGNLVTDYPTMGLCGLLPAFLAETPERAFVVGFGTGVSAGELAALDSIVEVNVAEISEAVVEAAPYFEGGNLGVLASPKVTIHRSDAYRALLRDEGRYDVIVSEPSNPWVTGVEMLYSLEFLQAARNRLAPGGVYAQWFHLYELNDDIVELVLRTYAEAFPYVSVWFTMGSDILLLGFDRIDGALDVAAMEARFNRADFKAGFGRVGIDSFPGLLAHEIVPIGVIEAGLLEGELHTLRHPRLSHMAGRSFFLDSLGAIPRPLTPDRAEIASRNSLMRRHAGDGAMPEDVLEAAVNETCRLFRNVECRTFLARWKRDHPGSERFAARLEAVRGQDRRAQAAFRDDGLDRLGLFFDGEGAAAASRLSLPDAKRVTSRYLTHYNYAIPFERAWLEALWGGCDRGACKAERQRLERDVGPLGSEERSRE